MNSLGTTEGIWAINAATLVWWLCLEPREFLLLSYQHPTYSSLKDLLRGHFPPEGFPHLFPSLHLTRAGLTTLFSIPTTCHQSPYLVRFTLHWGLASWEYAWPFHVTIWSSSVGRRSYLIKPPYRNAVKWWLSLAFETRGSGASCREPSWLTCPQAPPPVFQEHPPKRALEGSAHTLR